MARVSGQLSRFRSIARPPLRGRLRGDRGVHNYHLVKLRSRCIRNQRIAALHVSRGGGVTVRARILRPKDPRSCCYAWCRIVAGVYRQLVHNGWHRARPLLTTRDEFRTCRRRGIGAKSSAADGRQVLGTRACPGAAILDGPPWDALRDHRLPAASPSAQEAVKTLVTFRLIQSVVTLLGRSRGMPSARSRIREARTPIARETPNKTV